MHLNFKKWNLNKQEIAKFLEIAVKYAKHNRIAFKGLSLFHQNNILQICYDRLKAIIAQRNRIARSLKQMQSWFNDQIAEADPVEVCLRKSSKNAMCNLAKWYQSSKINPLFMALSRPCMIAVDMVGDTDRSLLPTKAELVLARQDFLSLLR